LASNYYEIKAVHRLCSLLCLRDGHAHVSYSLVQLLSQLMTAAQLQQQKKGNSSVRPHQRASTCTHRPFAIMLFLSPSTT